MKRIFVLLLVLIPTALVAAPLKVVNVSAPAINCVFSTTCKITVTDKTSAIWGGGFLQSRHYRALPGSPMAGRYVYEYRVDLRNSVGALALGAITSLTVDFGPDLMFDYNKDGSKDDVFVVTGGGLGNKGLSSAVRAGTLITFNFAGGGIAQGSAPGKGDSSYFFGIVSAKPRKTINVSAANTLGPPLSLSAWVPVH